MTLGKRRRYPLEQFLRPIIRVLYTMPESRLAVITNFIISVYILTLIWTGDVGGTVGIFGVVVINGVTSGLMYAFGKALEEAEKRQQKP